MCRHWECPWSIAKQEALGTETSICLGQCPHITWPGVDQNKGQHLPPPAKITSFYLAARQGRSRSSLCFHSCVFMEGVRGRSASLLLQGEVELLWNSEIKRGLEKTMWGDECRGKVEEAEEIPATCSHKGVSRIRTSVTCGGHGSGKYLWSCALLSRKSWEQRLPIEEN